MTLLESIWVVRSNPARVYVQGVFKKNNPISHAGHLKQFSKKIIKVSIIETSYKETSQVGDIKNRILLKDADKLHRTIIHVTIFGGFDHCFSSFLFLPSESFFIMAPIACCTASEFGSTPGRFSKTLCS
jgi:hypothetical protein